MDKAVINLWCSNHRTPISGDIPAARECQINTATFSKQTKIRIHRKLWCCSSVRLRETGSARRAIPACAPTRVHGGGGGGSSGDIPTERAPLSVQSVPWCSSAATTASTTTVEAAASAATSSADRICRCRCAASGSSRRRWRRRRPRRRPRSPCAAPRAAPSAPSPIVLRGPDSRPVAAATCSWGPRCCPITSSRLHLYNNNPLYVMRVAFLILFMCVGCWNVGVIVTTFQWGGVGEGHLGCQKEFSLIRVCNLRRLLFVAIIGPRRGLN